MQQISCILMYPWNSRYFPLPLTPPRPNHHPPANLASEDSNSSSSPWAKADTTSTDASLPPRSPGRPIVKATLLVYTARPRRLRHPHIPSGTFPRLQIRPSFPCSAPSSPALSAFSPSTSPPALRSLAIPSATRPAHRHLCQARQPLHSIYPPLVGRFVVRPRPSP